MAQIKIQRHSNSVFINRWKFTPQKSKQDFVKHWTHNTANKTKGTAEIPSSVVFTFMYCHNIIQWWHVNRAYVLSIGFQLCKRNQKQK